LQTGAETQLLTIADRRRNRPLALAEALDLLGDSGVVLLMNEQSGRAAVQTPAPSLMLDDGEIERRVRLVRPMERTHASLAAMQESRWRPADRADFAEAWNREVSETPTFSESTLHVVSGLLLPSGSGCRRTQRASTACRPMMASASSADASRPPGRRTPQGRT
jgi:hypothetical protein